MFLGPRSMILGPRSASTPREVSRGVGEASLNAGSFDEDGRSIFWCFSQLGRSRKDEPPTSYRRTHPWPSSSRSHPSIRDGASSSYGYRRLASIREDARALPSSSTMVQSWMKRRRASRESFPIVSDCGNSGFMHRMRAIRTASRCYRAKHRTAPRSLPAYATSWREPPCRPDLRHRGRGAQGTRRNCTGERASDCG